MFEQLQGARYFAKIDLSDAYWQIKLDADAQRLCAVNTSRGLFLVTRLQMGLKNSSAVFQTIMEKEVLKGLSNTLVYQDDSLAHAKTEDSLRKHYNAVLSRLKEKNMTVNKAKCVQSAKEIKFLGRVISSEGIRPNPELVSRIESLAIPSSHRELRSLLGLFGYYGRFIDQYADKLAHM